MGELSNTTINGVSYDFKDAGAARQSHSHTKSQITDFPTSMPASDVSAWAKASTKPTYTASEVGAIATTAKGAASGVAELDANGKVPSSQLPSFVDDVLEYSAKSSFPATGETGKIYVDTSNNKTYRWSGSDYVEISASLALGETSSTAYRGDRGKAAYDHSQVTSGNPHNVTKADVGLNNVGNFKAVSTVASQGLSDTEKSNARSNIGAGTSSLTLGTSSTQAAAGNHTHNYAGSSSAGGAALSVSTKGGDVQLGTPSSSSDDCGDIVFLYGNGNEKMRIWTDNVYTAKSGPNIRIFNASGTQLFTGKIPLSDGTGLPAASTTAAGLMSAADKTKLNGIATGAQVNSITGVKGNAESSYRTGNVNLTPANIGAAAASDVSVTANISMTTFATENGIAKLGFCTPCINKHGRHVTGFVMCESYSSTPKGEDTMFTLKSGYRPSGVNSAPVVFIPMSYNAFPMLGYVNNNGVLKTPDMMHGNYPVIMLFDYFTA